MAISRSHRPTERSANKSGREHSLSAASAGFSVASYTGQDVHTCLIHTIKCRECRKCRKCNRIGCSITTLLTHHYVEHHHQHKANGKTNGAEVRVLALAGFGNEFLYYDIEHGSCGKGQHIGEDGHHERGQ